MFFVKDEYKTRLANCKTSMQKHGFDVLVDSDPANMFYLTGYDGWSFYVPQAVVVALDDEDPIWIGRGVDINGAKLTTSIPDENIVSYPDYLVDNATEHPMDFLGAELGRRGLGGKRIAVERDCYFFTPRCRDALRAALPNAKFGDANRLVNWLRLYKSEAELHLIAQAAEITDRIMHTFFNVVEPGVRQCDAIADVYTAQARGTPEFGGEYCAIAPMMPTGAGTSTAHLMWNDKPFAEGEISFLETGGVRHRYHAPMVRTMFLGKPSQEIIDTSVAIVEGIGLALEAAKPGATCEDVELAWRKTIGKFGMTKESRIGYSIGIGYPPDWGEHTISLRPGETHQLQDNMAFHMVCGMWRDNWGIVISEPFRVSQTGGKPLSKIPPDLYAKN